MEVTVSDDTKSSDSSTITRPVAYIRDIPSFGRYTLNRFDEKGMLTWHNGQILHDEIWIKVGADHGGNSLKILKATHSCVVFLKTKTLVKILLRFLESTHNN